MERILWEGVHSSKGDSMPSRRDFLAVSLASGAALAMSRFARAQEGKGKTTGGGASPKRILILGGTGFLGPACSEAALARGHKVTLFNRGQRELKRKAAGRPSNVPDGAEVLYGNRDPKLTADDWKTEKDGPKDPESPKGLSQLEGKEWDAAIDTSGYFPRMVKASAELLAPKVKQYIFISSLSAYADNSKPGLDESDRVGILKDPTTEEMGRGMENYGPAKAACEAAAEAAMPGRVANVRPGYIVGQRDSSARFLYWPVRAEKGGEMAVPGKPTDPIQIIDVRDLAEWMVHLIETNTNGVFNATGPDKTLTMEAMVAACIRAAKSDAKPIWVDPTLVEKKGLEGQFPLWIPPEGEAAGFHQRSVAKAVKAGLKFRSAEDSAKSCLEWYHSLPESLQKGVVKLVDPEKEAALLAARTEPA